MTANQAQAQAWNAGHGEHFLAERARHERMLEAHTGRLLAAARIGPRDAVLDVGCGCGETTIRAAKTAIRGRALGADLSGVMLAEARRLADEQGAGNVSFVQADAQTHAFPAGAFDVVISRFGVMFFDDPAAAFANIAAALRPGGRLAFTCWQDPAKIEYLTVPFAAIGPYVTLPELAREGEPGAFSLARPGRIRGLLAGAGFGGITVEELSGPVRVGTDVEDVIAYYQATPEARSLTGPLDEHTAGKITAALREALRPFQREDGVWLGAAAWLVTAAR